MNLEPSAPDFDEETLRAWLHFANISLSARRMNVLLEHFQNDPQAILAASDAELEAAGCLARHIERLRNPLHVSTSRQWKWVEQNGVRLILQTSTAYPRLLREISDPPPLLFVRGTLEEADRFSVGMVGSRHATPYGKATAEKLAKELAGQGITVISGGAVGIDAASHRGALAGGGRTLAVLGCGLDVDYPRDNRLLFERVMAQGALITEFPLGAQPEAWRFPARNRLISGMSLGILVVEAPKQSGALITSRYAAEHNRPVMTVPGNIDRLTSVGSNELLKDGATPILETDDILRCLNLMTVPARPEHQKALPLEAAADESSIPAPAPPRNLPENQRRLLECLERTPRHIDHVAQAAGLSATQAGVEMTMMELVGLVQRLPGNTYIRLV